MTTHPSSKAIARGRARSAHTLLEILVVVSLLAVLGAVVLPSVASMVSGGSVKAAHEALASAVDEARLKARRANACYMLVLESSADATRVVLVPTDEAAMSRDELATLPGAVRIGWAPVSEDSAAGSGDASTVGEVGAEIRTSSEGAARTELCLVLPDGSLAPHDASRHTLRLTGRSGDALDFVLGRWRVSEAQAEVTQPEPASDLNTATELSPSVTPVTEAPVEPVGGPLDEEQDLLDP